MAHQPTPIYKYVIPDAAPLYYMGRRNGIKKYLTAHEAMKKANSPSGRYELIEVH